jgi:hypothetical protein
VARAEPVVQHVLGHEAASALLDPDQAAAFQLLHGAADGVAVHGEAAGQLRFGRQAGAGLVLPAGDLGLDRVLDLSPQRDALAAGETWGVRGGGIRHRNFNLRTRTGWQFRLDPTWMDL